MGATDQIAESSVDLSLSDARGRWTVAVCVLGSSMVFLDGSVVNVALPAIGADFGAGVSDFQWIVNGYLLALASLIIIGGSLGDRLGRRKVFLVGTVWFTAASVLCGLAPTSETLIAARVLQGIGGALLTPGSLAIIEASFTKADRGRAIGLWSGLAGASIAFGPPLGGWLIDVISWRAIFFLNVPLGVFVVLAGLRYVPETRGREQHERIDFLGAMLAAIGLGGVSYALIEGPARGVDSAIVIAAALIGALACIGFVLVERRVKEPMLPLTVFRSRTFSAANLLTFVFYAGLGGVSFFTAIFFQTALGYSPMQAGLATIPITIILLLGSSWAGGLAQRIGPRVPLTIGPLIVAASMALMLRIEPGSSYLGAVLPTLVGFGLGLVLIVAPVTATALTSVPQDQAGIASAVNNAVSRTGQLFAVAILPTVVGLQGDEFEIPLAITDAFHSAMLITAALSLTGSVIAWTLIDDDAFDQPESAPTPGGS